MTSLDPMIEKPADGGWSWQIDTQMRFVTVDGEKGPTLKGEHIAEEFQTMVEEYIAKTYARRETA